MSSIDEQIDRLFRAAGQVRPGPVSAPPFGFETRMLAAWRAASSAEIGFWDPGLLVKGLILACAIMAVSFVPAWNSTQTSSNPFTEYLQLTDSTVPSDETP